MMHLVIYWFKYSLLTSPPLRKPWEAESALKVVSLGTAVPSAPSSRYPRVEDSTHPWTYR